MVEMVSWTAVGIIALFAVVGFTGVVATSIVTVVRHARGVEAAPQPAEAYEHVRRAA